MTVQDGLQAMKLLSSEWGLSETGRRVKRYTLTDEGLAATLRERVWGKVAGHEAHLETGFRTFDGAMTAVGG